MAKTPLFYWDACVFIAYLTDEQREQSEINGLIDVAEKINSGEVRLVTSTLTHAEVLNSTLSKDEQEKFDSIMKRRNVEWADTSVRVWKLTHDIRDFYKQKQAQDNLKTLTTTDAVHLATAILYKVNELHTFDEKDNKKRRALIPLSGMVANKYPIVIKKPSMAQQSMDLQ